MDLITGLLTRTILQVFTSFLHNWPFLVISVIISVALKLYLDPAKVSALVARYRRVGVVGATALAVTTPLCSCGTTAVVLGMMASMIPWAPIIAFMVASPLTSPEELVYSAGLFGWPFALAFFISSIVLGLLGGLVGEILERRGWLVNQTRFGNPESAAGPAVAAKPAVAVKPASAIQPAMAAKLTSAASITSAPRTKVLSLVSAPLQMAAGAAGGGTISLCCGPVEVPDVVETPKTSPAACGCAAAPVQTSMPSCDCGSTPAQTATAECGCPAADEKAAAPSTVSDCGCSPVVEPANPTTCGCSGTVQSMAPAAACSCSTPSAPAACACSAEPDSKPAPVSIKRFLTEAWNTGKRLLVMFLGFAFIGYLLNGLIPAEWVAALFGKGNIYSVPLAATLGLPFYINTEGSLPLVRALIDGGMSQGAALAFLITGAGTSIGAVAGALTIARWRVIAVVIGTLWAGAVLLGYLYNALLLAGLV